MTTSPSLAACTLLAIVAQVSAKFITLEDELQLEMANMRAREHRREMVRIVVFAAALLSALLGLLRVLKDVAATYAPETGKVKRSVSEEGVMWLKKILTDPLSMGASFRHSS
mmetsp:Transcript_1990/g.3381  ORF Transcript_1990/g.3381 Transcript_1990/m.3381 type:complete len:112 (+) Transcript_1990:114-449(+)